MSRGRWSAALGLALLSCNALIGIEELRLDEHATPGGPGPDEEADGSTRDGGGSTPNDSGVLASGAFCASLARSPSSYCQDFDDAGGETPWSTGKVDPGTTFEPTSADFRSPPLGLHFQAPSARQAYSLWQLPARDGGSPHDIDCAFDLLASPSQDGELASVSIPTQSGPFSVLVASRDAGLALTLRIGVPGAVTDTNPGPLPATWARVRLHLVRSTDKADLHVNGTLVATQSFATLVPIDGPAEFAIGRAYGLLPAGGSFVFDNITCTTN